MSPINVALALSKMFDFHGADSDGDSEPYMWSIMFALDGSSITQSGDELVGGPRFFIGAGNQGNLGPGISTGASLVIPPDVGRWETTLQPIVISNPLVPTEVFEVPGVIGSIAVLMEENLTPNADSQVGHTAFNELVEEQLRKPFPINLDGVAAKVLALAQSDHLTRAEATERVLLGVMEASATTFEKWAADIIVGAIAKSLGVGGAIVSGLDGDEYYGSIVNVYTEAELALTEAAGEPGSVNMKPPLPLRQSIISQPPPHGHTGVFSPEWEFKFEGGAWQQIHYSWTAVAEGAPGGRLQVTGVDRATSHETDMTFITKIGGEHDGTPWWLERGVAVGLIERGVNSFYVIGKDGSEANVVVSDANAVGHNYLTTVADASTEDNLLSLPPCAAGIEHIESTVGQN